MTAYITGRIQNAGYRSKVVTIARALGIYGHVENLSDGRVKVVAEGDENDLERFAKALMIKDAIINVTDIERQFGPASNDYDGFNKMVGEGETDARLDSAVDHLKVLIDLTREGLVKQDQMLVKQDQMLDGQDQMLVKQDQMLDRQDQMLVKQDQMLDRQDQMLVKQDQMLDRQDQMLVKQDQMLDRQDQMLVKQDQMLDRQDQMLVKQDQMLEGQDQILGKQDELIGKMDEVKVGIIGEIKELRSDLKTSLGDRLSRIECDVAQIKTKIGLA